MDATATMSPPRNGTAAEALDPPKVAATLPTNALTPPTSEDLDMNHNTFDDASSDLSELDMDMDQNNEQENATENAKKVDADINDDDDDDDDDGEEIVPDHYYGDGNVPVFKPVCSCLPKRWLS